MRLCIFCFKVVAVIGCYQWNASLVAEVDEIPVDNLLLLHACGLQFQEEVILAENIAVFQGSLFGPGVTGGQQMRGHLTMQAGGKGN